MMKNVKKANHKTLKCAERDRLWASFLEVGREWQSMQDKMRKMFKQEGVFRPDAVKLEDIKRRLEAAHKLFGEHIVKHGCQLRSSVASRKRKNGK